MAPHAVEAHGLEYSYRGRKALDGVTFTVAPGEVLRFLLATRGARLE